MPTDNINKKSIVKDPFTIAAITNYHKFSDLKQYQFILLQLWTSAAQNGSPGLVASGRS